MVSAEDKGVLELTETMPVKFATERRVEVVKASCSNVLTISVQFGRRVTTPNSQCALQER